MVKPIFVNKTLPAIVCEVSAFYHMQICLVLCKIFAYNCSQGSYLLESICLFVSDEVRFVLSLISCESLLEDCILWFWPFLEIVKSNFRNYFRKLRVRSGACKILKCKATANLILTGLMRFFSCSFMCICLAIPSVIYIECVVVRILMRMLVSLLILVPLFIGCEKEFVCTLTKC